MGPDFISLDQNHAFALLLVTKVCQVERQGSNLLLIIPPNPPTHTQCTKSQTVNDDSEIRFQEVPDKIRSQVS